MSWEYFQVFRACWCALTNSWFVVDSWELFPLHPSAIFSTIFLFFSLYFPLYLAARTHTRNNFPYGRQFVCHAHVNLWFWRYFSPLAGFSPLCRAPCVFLWNLNLGYIVSNDDVDDEQRIPQRSITQLFIRWHLKCHQMSLDTWDCLHARRESIFPCLLEGKAPAKIEVSCC